MNEKPVLIDHLLRLASSAAPNALAALMLRVRDDTGLLLTCISNGPKATRWLPWPDSSCSAKARPHPLPVKCFARPNPMCNADRSCTSAGNPSGEDLHRRINPWWATFGGTSRMTRGGTTGSPDLWLIRETPAPRAQSVSDKQFFGACVNISSCRAAQRRGDPGPPSITTIAAWQDH